MSSQKSEDFLNSDTICDEFFIEVVENKLKIKRSDFKLRLVLLSQATGANENFSSIVYRAQVKIEIIATKEKMSVDVIVKAMLTEMSSLKEMKVFSVFDRERLMYEDLLTSFEKIWVERADKEIKFGPAGVKFESEPYEIIVLEDLKVEGFKMLDRKIGLNIQQSKMLLSRIARFHAASVIRHQKDGTINQLLDRKISLSDFDEHSSVVAGHSRLFKAFAAAINTFEGCKVYAEKILRWDDRGFMREYTNVGRAMKCGFQVLCHGDLWLNNMMFLCYRDGNSVDARLIDFQGPYWGSPAGDLWYFLLSSVADEIKVEHFDDFISYYHEILCEALKDLKYDQNIPTKLDLENDLLDKGAFACSVLLLLVCFVKNDSNQPIDILALLGSSESKGVMDDIFRNDGFRKAMQLWLPFLDKRGILDKMIKQ